MTDETVKDIIKDGEECIQRMHKVEEDAKFEVVKYFDRIHDKLFAYQLFFLAGYISLVAIPSIDASPWLLIIPVSCVWRLIYLDWKKMGQNRRLSDLMNQNKLQIDLLNENLEKINQQSLEIILESVITTVIFICVLL